MNITQSLQRWGNGTGVRIPKKVLVAANLHINQSLEVSLQGKSIVLTPVKEPKTGVTLETLLEGVTPATVTGELDWNTDTGAEKYE